MDRCFAALAAAWPNWKPLAETFALADLLLRPLEAVPVMTAVAELILDGGEFAPPLGALAQRAHGIAAGSTAPAPEAAIAEVWAAVSHVGLGASYDPSTGEASSRTPQWSHPALDRAVAAYGGWAAVCNDENPVAFRAHFLRLYEAAAKSEAPLAGLAPVLGRALAGAGVALPDLRAERVLGP